MYVTEGDKATADAAVAAATFSDQEGDRDDAQCASEMDDV